MKKKKNMVLLYYEKERSLTSVRIKNVIISLKLPKKYDILIQATVLLLIAFGTLMICSTTVGKTAQDTMALPKAMLKQGVFICVSYCLMMFFANNFSLSKFRKHYLIVGAVILIALFSTRFFTEVYGSKAWIRIPLPGMEVTLQPSEFAKVYLIVLIGLFVEMAGHRRLDFWSIVRIPVLFFAAMLILIVLQPDLGAAAILCLLAAICFLIPSHQGLRQKQKWVKWLLVIGSILALLFTSSIGIKILSEIPFLSHVAQRIENTINPFNDPFNTGYQAINGLYGIARGGLTGVGLGQSIQKYGYLTQSDNDYILSIIIEELGIFGFLFVVLCYGLLIQRLFYYAFRTKSEGYKVILIGSAMYIFLHFALNVGGVSGLIPLTGVPLLFISSGGSSLMSIMSAMGICQAIISRIRGQGADQLPNQRIKKKES